MDEPVTIMNEKQCAEFFTRDIYPLLQRFCASERGNGMICTLMGDTIVLGDSTPPQTFSTCSVCLRLSTSVTRLILVYQFNYIHNRVPIKTKVAISAYDSDLKSTIVNSITNMVLPMCTRLQDSRISSTALVQDAQLWTALDKVSGLVSQLSVNVTDKPKYINRP